MTNQSTTNELLWQRKEARELFCKAVNSLLMLNNKEMDLKGILRDAKVVVDEAFKNYPAPTDDKKENEIDIPTEK